MNLAVDVVCLRIHWREKVGHRVLFDIPIGGKNTIVVREYAAGDLRDIVDDFATFVGGTCPVSAKHLLAILLKDRDLWHVGIVYNVECFRHKVSMSPLRQRGCVWIADQRSLQVKLDILVLQQLPRESWDVLACVAFTCHVERLGSDFRESCVDVLHELNELCGSPLHVGQESIVRTL